jgi:energy-coupling factor transporter transmembrane protein EcfT
MKPLRILGVVVAIAFVLLLVVGFDNALALLRSRVAIFLALAPLLVLFFWSLYKAFRPRKNPRGYIDIPPGKP